MNEKIGLVCKQDHFHDGNFLRICSLVAYLNKSIKFNIAFTVTILQVNCGFVTIFKFHNLEKHE